MKTWTDVEKAFQDAGIHYQQKDWIFFCEIDEGKFYYSPQSGKWRVKRTRAWQPSNSVEDFIAGAKEYLQRSKEPKQSPKSNREHAPRQKSSRKKKSKKTKKTKKTKADSSNRQQNHRNHQRDRQKLRDEVRPEFLELFDEKIRVCTERNYKPAWIWISLLDKYFLTPSEICWLCTVFDYSPGWAFHQAKDQYPELSYREILVLMADNRSEWLSYFNSRWKFASNNEEKQHYHQQRQQEREAKQRHYQSSTQSDYRANRYQNHLDLLALNFPFSRQELKIAYRKKALKTHPDTGGTTEAFRRVHIAFEILSGLAS